MTKCKKPGWIRSPEDDEGQRVKTEGLIPLKSDGKKRLKIAKNAKKSKV